MPLPCVRSHGGDVGLGPGAAPDGQDMGPEHREVLPGPVRDSTVAGRRPPGRCPPGFAVRGGQRSGLGVKVWPRAVETSAKIRVAGVAQGRVLGSSASTGDSGQSPEAMSLVACTTTVVSVVVS